MVLALAQIERALQVGVALGIVLNDGNVDVLGEVSGLVLMIARLHAEQNAERVFAARQVFERDGDFVAGVEAEIEADGRLAGGYRTGDVLASFTGFEDR